jgi:Flp pilus assembly secretin CpaC
MMNWKTLSVCAVFVCAVASHALAQQPQSIAPKGQNQSNFVSSVSDLAATMDGNKVEYTEAIQVPAASRSIRRSQKKRGTVYLTPGSTKIFEFSRDAASVVVANPSHVSVFLDTPRTGIVMPRAPGATSFTVLDTQGHVLMTKNVVVSDADENYVRIRRICGGDNSCRETTVYYCDGNCVEVNVGQENRQ